MEIPSLQKILEQTLSEQLDELLPNHHISEVYNYAALPPGKLFRPLIAAGSFVNHNDSDLNVFSHKNSNVSKFVGFLELHHSYTLVHDDMPCMDDDDVRRGKTSTHKQYGQWQALLVGDGLQAASWRLLSQINHPSLVPLFRYSTWALGAKGLLQGQVLDLSEEMTTSFQNLILTHKLKTARLIQTSLVGGYLLTENPNFRTAKNYHRLGEALGVSFQLLDDLTELTEEFGEHEAAVNPWLWGGKISQETLVGYLEQAQKLTPKDAKLLREVLSHYFGTIYKKIESGRDSIVENISDDLLRPVESLLKILSNT